MLKPLLTHCLWLQSALEGQLTEEEQRRNSRRRDLIYMLSSHPLAPDAYEVAEAGIEGGEGKHIEAAAAGVHMLTAGMASAHAQLAVLAGCLGQKPLLQPPSSSSRKCVGSTLCCSDAACTMLPSISLFYEADAASRDLSS